MQDSSNMHEWNKTQLQVCFSQRTNVTVKGLKRDFSRIWVVQQHFGVARTVDGGHVRVGGWVLVAAKLMRTSFGLITFVKRGGIYLSAVHSNADFRAGIEARIITPSTEWIFKSNGKGLTKRRLLIANGQQTHFWNIWNNEWNENEENAIVGFSRNYNLLLVDVGNMSEKHDWE